VDLFDAQECEAGAQRLAPGAVLLRGHAMSVATTSCGRLGWHSDDKGYRYTALDPLNSRPWPDMPTALRSLAAAAAEAAGYPHFEPDTCLINRYAAGARLTLHQDRHERSHAWPIVSVSLGIPAVFVFGGARRSDRIARLPLTHGDVVVWGGPSRLNFHGVLPLLAATHPLTGDCRINLTFRRAG
jgi:alkylated DNA repair protein (DNA oxidative demethylase)